MDGSALLSPYPIYNEKKDNGRSKQDIELLKQGIEIPDEILEWMNYCENIFILAEYIAIMAYNLPKHM